MSYPRVLQRIIDLEEKFPVSVKLIGNATGQSVPDGAGSALTVNVAVSQATHANSADYSTTTGYDAYPNGQQVGLSFSGLGSNIGPMPYSGFVRVDLNGASINLILFLITYAANGVELLSLPVYSNYAQYAACLPVRKGHYARAYFNGTYASASAKLCIGA